MYIYNVVSIVYILALRGAIDREITVLNDLALLYICHYMTHKYINTNNALSQPKKKKKKKENEKKIFNIANVRVQLPGSTTIRSWQFAVRKFA